MQLEQFLELALAACHDPGGAHPGTAKQGLALNNTPYAPEFRKDFAMRFLAVVMMVVLLMFAAPAASQASATSGSLLPPTSRSSAGPALSGAAPRPLTQNCAARQANMASLGRPSQTAQLVASANGLEAPDGQSASSQYVVQVGDTLSRIAARYNTSVRSIMQTNGLTDPNYIYVGQRLTIPGVGRSTGVSAPLASPLEAAWVDGEAIQGEAAVVWLLARSGAAVTGRLGNQTIPFQAECGLLWGLVAFDALLDSPGLYNLALTIRVPDGRLLAGSVPISLRPGAYPVSRVMSYPTDRQQLLDPALIRSENERLNALFASLSATSPRWSGAFRLPLDSYITNVFGHMGTVDGGPPTGYHEGIDFRGRVGTPVPAPAGGVVVLAEPLTVRGGTVFIDHGAGVVTGYFHLSQIDVKVGDTVTQGLVIGRVGATGLVTGPHLHWELRVNGRWVSPMTFVRRAVP